MRSQQQQSHTPRLGGTGSSARNVASFDHLFDGSVKIRVRDACAPATKTAQFTMLPCFHVAKKANARNAARKPLACNGHRALTHRRHRPHPASLRSTSRPAPTENASDASARFSAHEICKQVHFRALDSVSRGRADTSLGCQLLKAPPRWRHTAAEAAQPQPPPTAIATTAPTLERASKPVASPNSHPLQFFETRET